MVQLDLLTRVALLEAASINHQNDLRDNRRKLEALTRVVAKIDRDFLVFRAKVTAYAGVGALIGGFVANIFGAHVR